MPDEHALSQLLPETDYALDLVEAERAMRGRAPLIRDLGVRPELGEVLRAAPLLHRRDERAADALMPCLRFHEPAFQIGDTTGIAAPCVRTNGRLRKADDLT